MGTVKEFQNKYPQCPPRVHPDIQLDEDAFKEIAGNARIAPLYESGMSDYIHRKHYSLKRNPNLMCTWAEYKKAIESRVFAPFQFPDHRDLHFYNCAIRFMPSRSEHKRTNFRKCLKPGPGVDYGGQMPIPQEFMMKRGTPLKEGKGDKKKRKAKKEKPKEEEAAK